MYQKSSLPVNHVKRLKSTNRHFRDRFHLHHHGSDMYPDDSRRDVLQNLSDLNNLMRLSGSSVIETGRLESSKIFARPSVVTAVFQRSLVGLLTLKCEGTMVFPGVGDNWARKATHKTRILSRNFICQSSRLDMAEDENIQAAGN